MAVLLANLLWILVFPLLSLCFVPWWLRSLLGFQSPQVTWLSVWFWVNGVGLMGFASHWLLSEGAGGLGFWAAPQRCILRGPYRFVRNPMALGMALVLLGFVEYYHSAWICFYAILWGFCVATWIHWVEEPELARKFGPLYLDYCRKTPCWVPRPFFRARKPQNG